MRLLRAALPVLAGFAAGFGVMLSLVVFHYQRDLLGTQIFLGSAALAVGAVALARALSQD